MDTEDPLVLRVEPAAGCCRLLLVNGVRGTINWAGEGALSELAGPVTTAARKYAGRIRRVEISGPSRLANHSDINDSVGVVLIGFMAGAARQVRALRKVCLHGAIDVTGNEARPWDEAGLAAALAAWKVAAQPDADSDSGPACLKALAVGGVNSTMNPAHERRAAEAARQITRVPVVEGRYFRDAASAIDRAVFAAGAAGWLAEVRALVPAVRAAMRAAGMAGLIHVPCDGPLGTAWIAAGARAILKEWDIELDVDGLRLEAWITRISKDCYACHCDDGRYDFDSLLSAKTFGENRLRERLSIQAGEMGKGEVMVQVRSEDRFGQGRGRKGPMRVYLGSTITAWVDQCPDGG